MNKTNIYNENILSTKVKISPNKLNKNYQKYILTKLQTQLEGIFSKFGLIKQDSIELIKVSLGRIEQHGFEGNILYDVLFKALICNPVIGNIILCEVINTNNFGILCSSKEDDNTIIEIIIPKKSFAIKSDINLNDIKIGNKVYVEIAGKKPQLNDTKIKCIGKIIKTSGKSKVKLDTDIEQDEQIITEVDIEYEDIDVNDEDDDDEVVDDDDEVVDEKSDGGSISEDFEDLSDSDSNISDNSNAIILKD